MANIITSTFGDRAIEEKINIANELVSADDKLKTFIKSLEKSGRKVEEIFDEEYNVKNRKLYNKLSSEEKSFYINAIQQLVAAQKKGDKHGISDTTTATKITEEAEKNKNLKSQQEDKAKLVGKITKVLEMAGQIAVSGMRIAQENWLAEQDISIKILQTKSKLFQKQMEVFGTGLNNTIKSSFMAVTAGVQESAYHAAESSIDYATDMTKMLMDRNLEMMKLTHFQQERLKSRDVAQTEEYFNMANSVVSGAGAIFGGKNPLIDAAFGLISAGVNVWKQIATTSNKQELERLKKINEEIQIARETLNDITKQAIDNAARTAKEMLSFTNEIEKGAKLLEASAKQISSGFGLSGVNAQMYQRFMGNALQNLGVYGSDGKFIRFNKTSEDIAKIQEGFGAETGRNVILSEGDLNKQFALGKLLGDDSIAAQLTAGMNYFNQSVESSSDMIYDMYQNANKLGLSSRKYSQDLLKNLKLAEKYTFAGGVRGMMNMALWAQNARFNVDSLEGMINKVQQGGLSGVIQQAAQLQVLGGAAAMGSNPLGMMFEAWNDPNAYARRMHSMTRGLGRFNSETGEVDIKGADAMMVAAIAQAQGRSVEDLRKEITQRLKVDKIKTDIGTDKFTDEQLSLIANKAQRKSNGEWFITGADGVEKDVRTLNENDLTQLLPHEEKIESYVADILSIMEKEQATSQHMMNMLAVKFGEDVENAALERMANTEQMTNFFRTDPNFEKNVDSSMIFTTKMQKQSYENFMSNSEVMSKQIDLIYSQSTAWSNAIKDNTQTILDVLDLATKEIKDFDKNMKMHLDEINTTASKYNAELTSSYNFNVDKFNSLDRESKLDYLRKHFNFQPEYYKEVRNDDYLNSLREKIYESLQAQGLTAQYVTDADNFNLFDPDGMFGTRALRRATLGKSVESGRNLNILTQPINDGIVDVGRGVTPIEANPKDTAIFAKDGGPFDKLFNDTFGKVNAIEKNLNNSNSSNKIDVNINGRLELTSNGQSVDLMNVLRSDPLLLRKLTEMITNQINSQANGGKSTQVNI